MGQIANQMALELIFKIKCNFRKNGTSVSFQRNAHFGVNGTSIPKQTEHVVRKEQLRQREEKGVPPRGRGKGRKALFPESGFLGGVTVPAC